MNMTEARCVFGMIEKLENAVEQVTQAKRMAFSINAADMIAKADQMIAVFEAELAKLQSKVSPVDVGPGYCGEAPEGINYSDWLAINNID